MARNLNEEYGSRVIGGRRCVHVREVTAQKIADRTRYCQRANSTRIHRR